MKVMKTITIDHEIVDKLNKESNISGFINSLLAKHYEGEDLRKMSKEQLTKLLELLEIKEKADAEIEAIKNGKG